MLLLSSTNSCSIVAMLTRRSRKEGASPKSPFSEESDVGSPKVVPLKKSPRSKSKSIDRNVRSRSKSKNRKNPIVLIERYSDEETSKKKTKKLKSVQPVNSKEPKTPPTSVKTVRRKNMPTAETSITNDNGSGLMTRSMSSILANDASKNESKLSNNTRITNAGVEFGGLFGNLILAFFLPILVVLSKIAIKNKGILIPFPRGYLRFGNYYDQDVFLWSGSLLIIQLLISLVPLAKKTEGLHRDNSNLCSFRFSGFMNFIVGALIVAGLEYYKISINFILEMVTKKNVPHVVASILNTFVILIAVYVTAKLKKQISVSKNLNWFQNFFIGTSLNPTLGPINIKLALYRYSFLLTILNNYLAIMDSLNYSINLHLYVVAGLQIIYALDKLVFEFNLLSSFYLQREKVGYWTTIQLLLLPAINFLPIQILLTRKISVNYITLGVSSILFLLGIVCQRYSDYVKYNYESSSFSVKRSYGGRKFTDYSLWLYARYPNYLGAIIAHFAIILPTIELNPVSLLASWPVFVYVLYYLLTLSHRCVRVSNEGLSRYGVGWDQQFASKWNIIPKIF